MDILKSNLVVGVAAALAATVLVPLLVPVVGGVGRPFAKSILRNGLTLYEKSREAAANMGEAMEDLIAEVRADAARQGSVTARTEGAAAASDAAAEEKAQEGHDMDQARMADRSRAARSGDAGAAV